MSGRIMQPTPALTYLFNVIFITCAFSDDPCTESMHEIQEGYYSAAWLEPDLATADGSAEELLRERRVAAGMGSRFR